MRKRLFVLIVLAVTLACVRPASAEAADSARPSAHHHTVHPHSYEVAEQAGVKASLVHRYDDGAYSVASEGGTEPVIIDLGWIPIKSETTYLARYRLRAEAIRGSASVYLMVREHTRQNTRPITPYHKESVQRREVAPGSSEEWMERELSLTTGAETRALSAAIVISDLDGELHFSAVDLLNSAVEQERAEEEAAQEYEKLMAEIRAQADSRGRLVPRTLVFSRSQMKYGLERNYYHEWIDRPLLVNRAYRVPTEGHVTPYPSYRRILEEVAKYDIDGLAFFPETHQRMGIFELHERAGLEHVSLLPEFLGRFRDDHLEMKMQIIERALQSPYTPRIDGKLLITSYGAASLSPAEWEEILSALREQHGDSFIFLPSLTNVVGLRSKFMNGEPISRAEIEEKKQYLRDYLDVCDGIYFNFAAALRNNDRTFDDAFYRQVFIPVFKSVLSEPAYRDKYLALNAYKSHMNPDRGNSLHEDHTRTLRRSFEAAMDAEPDIIILPEWDEFNENTCFRPTVYGGTTTMRILRYYMSQIKATDPTPVPGDDADIPNLILSTRKAVTLGESITIELLNVPDSATSEPYQASLTLVDEDGQIVHAFGPVEFDAAELQEHRFHLPSETIPDVRAVVPTLAIKGYRGRDLSYDAGFHHVQLRATWNWDYLSVKQPLRDLFEPESLELAWEPSAEEDGPLVLSGQISSPEELALVEVLGDDDEVYAVDPDDEFFRDDPDRQLLMIEYRANHNGNTELEGSVTLKNATAEWLVRGTILHQPEMSADIDADRVEIKSVVSEHRRWIYMAIPRDMINDAELSFDFDRARFALPIREVIEKQMIARSFDDGLHITVYPYRRQLDMPHHLNSREASFRAEIWPEIDTEQYHLRLTTVDGKTFRSAPLLLPGAGEGVSMRPLRIFSNEQQRPVDVAVAADRIPDIRYEFDPERGAVLLTDAGRPFWATLGGFTNTTTGRGTYDSLFRGFYPEDIERGAPQWIEEDSTPVLRFNGAGSLLVLPREAIPRRGSFTIEFEVKPTSAQDQLLLANRIVGGQPTGLMLQIRDGKLHGSFRDADWRSHQLATGLDVPADAWSTIRVRHDFEHITLTVNGQAESFPHALPAYNVGFTVIGEGLKGNWFAGDLRNLRIRHNAE